MSSPPTAIPRIFHFVWVGGAPLPAEEREWIESWRKFHPLWELRMWGDESLDCFELRDLIAQAKNPAQVSDLMRFELMAKHGGIYLDTDMECLRPLDDLIEGIEAFFGLELPKRPAQGILGAVPGHPLFMEVFEALKSLGPLKGDNLNETGPHFFGRQVAAWLQRESPDLQRVNAGDSGLEVGFVAAGNLLIANSWVFYPYYMGDTWEPSRHVDSFAAHHWRGSWFPAR